MQIPDNSLWELSQAFVGTGHLVAQSKGTVLTDGPRQAAHGELARCLETLAVTCMRRMILECKTKGPVMVTKGFSKAHVTLIAKRPARASITTIVHDLSADIKQHPKMLS
jgi:hypothetical protein